MNDDVAIEVLLRLPGDWTAEDREAWRAVFRLAADGAPVEVVASHLYFYWLDPARANRCPREMFLVTVRLYHGLVLRLMPEEMVAG